MIDKDGFVIETHRLGKTYRGVTALKSLDLKVPRHSIYGFLGPNGAGKTTAIKLLLGLGKPTNGSAMVFGQDVVRDSVDIRRRIGYLAQEPHYYDFMTARETLRFTAGFFFTGSKAAIERRIDEVLTLVGLEHKGDRPIKGFSGGERQRLGIAQAQINFPDLLILDEPAASLDPMGRYDVLKIMERLREHTTIFYSTHILSDVQRVSDRVAILNHGELLAEAPISELLAGASGKVIYNVTLQGNVEEAQLRVRGQPWVSALDVSAEDGSIKWRVSVTDEVAAELKLVSLVQETGDVRVSDYGREHRSLENIFVSMVEVSNSDR